LGVNPGWTPVDVLGFGNVVIYSISGRVTTGGSGQPLAGVTVSASGAGSAITDGNGAYTISGLVAGTYTLTPSKPGYIFTPTSRTVAVPPDVQVKDFVGVATPKRVFLPLLLKP
jgi:hypothetical protein